MKRQIDRRVLTAADEARIARARVMATLDRLRHRVDPRVMAAETAEQALDGATSWIAEATTSAKSRPWLLGIVATVIGIAMTAYARYSDDDTQATNATDKS